MKIHGLSLSYGPSMAFEDISLQIPAKQITAIIGPSGCGKTSFLMCLNRLSDLLPGCSVTGSIYLGNTNLRDPSADLVNLRRTVGTIFQSPNPFPMSILKNMELPLQAHGHHDRGARLNRIERVLTEVGLWSEVKDKLRRAALELSGGQQQRLCIARALVLEPKVLLFDEPCSALDPLSSAVVEDLIHSLREHYTVVMVTHHLAQAQRIADQVALFWVRDGIGYLVESGSKQHMFENPSNEITTAYIKGVRG